ncbi:archaetidylserine decarboxylase [Methylophilus medardicus]|uniref:Phosphatidylserine decarboxylase proenzyme n=1 Tax=Methylophilus medardicus TaxID=2588534 RepID=A0A5B8CUH2_9PROT|nr:archaetidylserine decarboxylase [Methylophilus medardicus]QDC44903.1 phosphatidylserine decarboxylase [Methylophilus medardicus]QDC49910.1 phosphatidylserine decarboxylase [Methylophilus medardicus]QDC53615.1 phosphatidylserine decarboxylase [Methylophilus medardicus]
MKLAILLQYIAPKQLLTAAAGKLAHWQAGRLTTAFIGWFVRKYQVNMEDAVNGDLTSYVSFNQFFTRPLKPGARVLADNAFVCPVDGCISQFGQVVQGQIFQAKGHQYSAQALVGGDATLAARFDHGSFACLYLSPKDYHRIHMPCDGTLLHMTYVPGDLFSVNPLTAANVPGLFARNERVVCTFNSAQHGQFVLVLVGATIVGSMATVWHDAKDRIINPPRPGKVVKWDYSDRNIHLKQGEEMGRFLLGSTVVMLFEKDMLTFNTGWHPGKPIRLGEAMGK